MPFDKTQVKMVTNDNGSIQALYSVFTKPQKGWIVFLVAFTGWFSTLSSFIYFPAITALSTDLNTSIKKINLTITSYLLASAVIPSIVGKAADTSGRRPIFIVTLAVYLAANVGLALQSSFAVLFVLRMVQAAGITGIVIYSIYFRGEKRGADRKIQILGSFCGVRSCCRPCKPR